MSDEVYATIRDGSPAGTPIGHGMTYSAHPVSAAVGLAVMKLYLEGGLLANGQKMGRRLAERLAPLADHPLVGELRGRGMLHALELVTNKRLRTKPDRSLGIAAKLFSIGYRHGLIFRAFADDVIGLAPPLCCTAEDIDTLVARLTRTLDDVLDVPEIRAAIGG